MKDAADVAIRNYLVVAGQHGGSSTAGLVAYHEINDGEQAAWS